MPARSGAAAGEPSRTKALEELAQYFWRVALRLKLELDAAALALDGGSGGGASVSREGERRQLLADVEELVERSPQSRNPFLAFFDVLLPRHSHDRYVMWRECGWPSGRFSRISSNRNAALCYVISIIL